MIRHTLLALGIAAGWGLSMPVQAQSATDSVVQSLQQRLRTIASDPHQAGATAYERLRAEQAVQTLATSRGKQRDFAMQMAQRRVDIAETAARTASLQREVEQLDRQRNELLLEASRQDAARARAEAERLRVQAQIQAEEAQRLRAEAEAATLARDEAETLVLDVGGAEAERLRKARERAAELQRQEAELSGKGPERPKPND